MKEFPMKVRLSWHVPSEEDKWLQKVLSLTCPFIKTNFGGIYRNSENMYQIYFFIDKDKQERNIREKMNKLIEYEFSTAGAAIETLESFFGRNCRPRYNNKKNKKIKVT